MKGIISYFSLNVRKLKIYSIVEPKDTYCFNGYMTTIGDFELQSSNMKTNLLFEILKGKKFLYIIPFFFKMYFI